MRGQFKAGEGKEEEGRGKKKRKGAE